MGTPTTAPEMGRLWDTGRRPGTLTGDLERPPDILWLRGLTNLPRLPGVPRLSRDPLLVVYAFVGLGFVLPGQLIVGPLGGLGAPATLVSLGAVLLYLLARTLPRYLASGFQPVGVAMLALGVMSVISYAVGQLRVLSPLEANGSVRGLLFAAGYVALGLVVADGTVSRRHLDRLLQLIVGGACFMALLGIVQFLTDIPPEAYIQVPGLQLQDVDVDAARSMFVRVKATALHPIEFGVVLAIAFPLALHYATQPLDGVPPARWRWVPVGILLVASPMAVSRSSVLGLAVAAVVIASIWPAKMRVEAAIAGAILLVAMRFAFPGLLGTLRSMFTFFGEDPSIEGRTKDYPQVLEYVSERPWLGRGLATFNPEEYFFLDNEYLGVLLTMGVLGLLVLLTLFAVAIGTARGVYHHAAAPEDRALGQALVAATAVSLATWITYDGMGFRLNAGLAFIVMGAGGALWRLTVGRPRWGVGVNRTRPDVHRAAERTRGQLGAGQSRR